MIKLLLLSYIAILFSTTLAFASEEGVADKDIQAIKAPTEVSAGITTASTPTPTTAISGAKSSLNESDIPLNVDLNKKSTDTTATSTRLFLTAFILISIMGVTYFAVRKYKFSNSINKSNTKIKILSQHYLGPKKSLAIIHVAGESMLIGVTDSTISMIKSLSLIDDEVPANLPQNFADTLQIKTQRAAGATSRSMQAEELEEEFSFAGVKDSVSKKIKSMRSLS